ncbi:hypothetical protein E2C01_053536 [Portunus trituberculatus]|uniref:Uncharacterized protein n=1 Tax=Portunus trituberculatus TaxID=210409 RepID=A0A5B7GSC6_PORTR|nr:hypothetical protein [Portunus trituberculatus]
MLHSSTGPASLYSSVTS